MGLMVPMVLLALYVWLMVRVARAVVGSLMMTGGLRHVAMGWRVNTPLLVLLTMKDEGE